MSAAIRALPRTHAFILAGGQGERLTPLTLSRPKPLIPFGGIFRIIDFSILNALNSGLSQISILTQYRFQDVHDYIRNTWSRVSADLRCFESANGKRYRGTADAVYRNLPVVGSYNPEFVLILSGDHVYNMDYRKLIRRHIRASADLTIAAVECPVEEASQFGVIEVEQSFKIVGFQEKPREPHTLPGRSSVALVSMGVYIFRTKALHQVLQ
jgi:glucose-1-phosphate adenylyltransferase